MAPDFDRLVNRHKDAVYRQLLRLCGNHADAEDVLSEALINAFRGIEGLQDRAQFQAWLVQIGRRVCGRLKKKEALRPYLLLEEVDASATADPMDRLDENALRDCLHQALDRLPRHYRDVYDLRDIQEHTAQETGEMLGITVSNVKSRLHRARAMVRKYVDAGMQGSMTCDPEGSTRGS